MTHGKNIHLIDGLSGKVCQHDLFKCVTNLEQVKYV